MNLKRIELIFELLVFGIIVGVIEDLIAVKLATGESITSRVLVIVVMVAIPFAILGELVIDRINFVEIFRKIFGNKESNGRNQS